MAMQLRGVMAALLTPFTQQQMLDTESLRRLVQFNIEQGIDGLYVGGSTGEAFVQSLSEREQVMEIVAEEAKGKITLIAHVGCVSTAESQRLATAAARFGFDAVSAVTPFYYPFSFEEHCDHYRAIIDSADGLPMVVYNIPALSGVVLAGWEWVYEPFDGDGYIPDFLIKSDHPLLVEVKPATLESEYREPIPKITKGIGDLWKHDLIILGADIYMKGGGAGILIDFLAGPDDWHTSVAHWVNCPWCVSMGIVTDQTSGYMRPCSHDAPKGGDQPNNLAGLWRAAGNAVQWRAA